MKIRILGASGGIGAQARTTSLLVDQDILIDAASELAKLKSAAQVHITHLMPGREDDIMREITRYIPHNTPQRLERGQIFEL